MEHSYSRDCKHSDDVPIMNTRSIMVHRPPQCPSCHVHTHDEVDLEDFYSPPIPSYNETAAKDAMEECEKLTQSSKNNNSEEVDWELSVPKYGWSAQQSQLFDRICRILDLDRLARLAHKERQHEPVLRRVVIDKSVQRFRQALSNISWDPKLTQWLHGILMDYLPASYLAAYIDILQTLKAKIPTLVDKMIFGRSGANQDLLRPIFKRPWDPIVDPKTRKLPNQPIIVVVPSAPSSGQISSRNQKIYSLLSTMAAVVPVQCHFTGSSLNKQGLQFITDQLMSVTRAKIQEIKNDTPNRSIILVGINAGAALALQIGLVETVSCIICMGFSFNTVHGVRGAPDDHILDIVTPILFIIGQNSARVSQEEIESLREKMQAQTSLVVVGSADESLRIGKTKRQIEGVTQTMIDNMLMDEIAEFSTTCLINPPGPRTPTVLIPHANTITSTTGIIKPSSDTNNITTKIRKRKQQNSESEQPPSKTKTIKSVGRSRPSLNSKNQNSERPQLMPLTNPSSEALDMAIQSILPEANIKHETISQPNSKLMTSYEIIPASPNKPKLEIRQISQVPTSNMSGNSVMLPLLQRTVQKVKVIPPNQFLQLKPSQSVGTQKVFTLKTAPKVSGTSTPQIYTVKNQTGTQIRGNKVYTIKSNNGTQIITTPNIGQTSNNPIVISPKKFTLMKTLPADHTKIVQPDLSNTNIFDIPIVFADNDGNIHETTPIISSPSQGSSFVISPHTLTSIKDPKIISSPKTTTITTQANMNRSIVINNLLANKSKQNKLVLINRNAVKGVQNILPKNIPPIKYTKVVVPSSGKETSTMVSSVQTSPKTFSTILTNSGQQSQKIEILNSSIFKQAQSFGGSTNLVTSNSNQKYQPIIINVDANKNPINNVIKVGDTKIKPQNTIMIKSGTGLKQFPMLKTGLLSRNLTVKKVVNIVPQKKIFTGTSTTIPALLPPLPQDDE